MYEPDEILPGPGVTQVGKLSKYLASLAGTTSDSSVYYMDSGKAGLTVLILGGTHPNEPAGFITATVLIESITVQVGRLIVIPQACQSGFTCTDPLEGYPEFFSIRSRSKLRTFRFGSRAMNPIPSWPDPLVYLHYPSGQQLAGNEIRNLNRCYPGRLNGTAGERIGNALIKLIEEERVDIAVDLHEAAPEIPIINAIVTHEKDKEIGASALLNLEFENLQYSLELSPPQFHGLSHREWGDRTATSPFLMETSNPIQGRLRGPTSASLIVEGIDKRYQEAARLGTIKITYENAGEPLARRVGRHLRGLTAILGSFQEIHPETKIVLAGVPSYEEVLRKGIGAYLQ
jgi:predicted deacylase